MSVLLRIDIMAALAAAAVKSQRKRAANRLTEQAMSNVNEQKQFLNNVAQKHRDSIISISTLDSLKNEVPFGLYKAPLPPRPTFFGFCTASSREATTTEKMTQASRIQNSLNTPECHF